MRDYNKLNFGVSVLALIVAVVGVALAYLAIEASWKIAEATGSLDKSDFVIGLQRYPFPAGGHAKLIVGASEISKKDVPVIGAIPFGIISNGKKSVENLSVTFQYHQMFKRTVLESMSLKASGDYISQEVKHSYTEAGDMSFASYRIPMLNPGVGVGIAEPLFLLEQHLNIEAPVTSKDGVNFIMPVELTLSQSFAVNVSGRDITIRNYVIDLSVEKASSIEELRRLYVPKAVTAEQEKIRNELGFFSYLGSLVYSSIKGSIYLVYVPLSEVKVGDVRLYAPKGAQSVAVVEFDLLTWSKLFKAR